MNKSELGNSQHDKFMAENFDMKCDFCDAVFNAFVEARVHYREYHNDERGYLKCCTSKLRSLATIKDHIESHLNPELFK